MLKWIQSGALKIRSRKTYRLAEARQAHRDLEGRKTSGKAACCFHHDFGMNRRARLTLISVCLVALLTGLDFRLLSEHPRLENSFNSHLDRADLLKRLAADDVRRSLEQQPSLPIPEALAERHRS